MIDAPIAVFTVLAAATALSIWLEEHTRIFGKLGAAPLVILVGMLFSNTGILPGESPTYEFLMSAGVSAGIVLILLGVDLDSIRKAGPEMLKAFGVGALGSIVGSMVMAFILVNALGSETWKLAGQFTGTYIGGGMNFAALAQTFDTDNDIFTAAIAADVILTALWLLICLALPVLLNRGERVHLEEIRETPQDEEEFTIDKALYRTKSAIRIYEVALLVTITIGAMWLSEVLENAISAIPKVIWLTGIALVIAQVRVVKKLPGGAMLGNYFILLFLASNGAKSVVANIIEVGPAVFYYALGTVTIHGLIIFGLGWLLKINAGTLAVASQANVGGSASAMALASARGYGKRILPGIAVGLLGYAVGNFLGVLVGNLMKGLL